MNKSLKNIILVILSLVAIVILLNAPYFYKQIKYFFSGEGSGAHQVTLTENPATPNIGESNILNIPSLGITAPIVEAQISEGQKTSTEKDFQEALKTGVVHYPGTAEVGQPGNAYIFGHSSDFAFKGGNFKTVFALLPHIEKGSEIVVSDKNGQIFHYVVTDSFVAASTDVHLLDQREYKEKLLTLQTSYPIGTALKRWIVIAKLKE